MDLRLRRALGMLRLGKAAEAAEAAAEAGQEAGRPPLAAISVAARLAAAGAKSFCDGEAEDEALEELAALKVSPVVLCFIVTRCHSSSIYCNTLLILTESNRMTALRRCFFPLGAVARVLYVIILFP